MSLPKNFDPSKSNSPHRPEPLASSPANDHAEFDSTTQSAIITGVGRSAIAVISLRGVNAGGMVAVCFETTTKCSFLPNQIRYGLWTGPSQERPNGESVVVTPLNENHFEIHCHGGPAATTRIIDDLCTCGAIPIASEDLTIADNLLIREAQQVLTQCLTARTAAIAMDQARGAMSDWATSRLCRIEKRTSAWESSRREAGELLRFAEFGTRLGQPFRVVLTGPPNVGKSSLLNAILGYDRSITFDAAGTTRDVLHAETVIDGLPIRLSDTAGIRASDEPLEQQGVARAQIAADQADLVIAVCEPQSTDGQASTREEAFDHGATEIVESSKRVIRVLNKSDLLVDPNSHDLCDVATNALTGHGVAELVALIANYLCDSMPKPGAPVPITGRQARLLSEIRAAESREVITAKLRELLGVSI
jgi:tRNA modification GTPase